ncbi:glycosyltransferase 87 family protein [Saccharomonospora sp. NPDC046836]|uniref:glycosyltransferase 87 family protein n=1 Tax=Saccharomonospora sp. NPDC046836 TaxID=3156921 RepID=UPI003410C285
MGRVPVPGWLRASWQERPLGLDIVFYLLCTGYAVALALTDKHYGFRVWATVAVAGYGLALVHACWLRLTPRARDGWWRSRWMGVGAVGVVAMIVPLTLLVARRLYGGDWVETPGAWSAQPEVWVIERSASLLLSTGTPYVDVDALGRAPVVNDYTPYGPVMALFGLPRALVGGTPVVDALTDARLYFALTAVLCVWGALRLLGRPAVPVRAAQLVAIFPLTALTWATAGPDLAIAGLLVLGATLAAIDRPLAAAGVVALVTSAKLIVLPAVVVLGALVLARLGRGALARFTLVFLGVCAAVNVPVYLVNPQAFVEHVIRFPAGLGAVTSPAASPLPGHLIASTGTVGKAIAFGLLGTAALAIFVWIVRRPPTTGAQAFLRIAVGLGTFTMLTPATRFGYLVYPVVLLGAMLCLPDRDATPLATAKRGPATEPGTAPLTSS